MAGLHRPPHWGELGKGRVSRRGPFCQRGRRGQWQQGLLPGQVLPRGPQLLRWQVQSFSGGLCCAHLGASTWHPVLHRCKRVNSAEGQNRKQQLLTPAGTPRCWHFPAQAGLGGVETLG